jgi:hypothetical protein
MQSRAGTYGSPRVSAALRAQGEREAGIEGRQRRRYRVRTTDSQHDEPIAPNRFADASPPAMPDEVWVPTSPLSKLPGTGYTWPVCLSPTAGG